MGVTSDIELQTFEQPFEAIKYANFQAQAQGIYSRSYQNLENDWGERDNVLRIFIPFKRSLGG